ncbi:MAG: pyridoxal-phosphate dependent enzyme [Flavobacteriales bacterium]|nr:pyridoxal-phosphate dependent enzyme [Flavobacteriales bacterium]
MASRGIELYIKRDDLLHTFISGNKWRKLKYNYAAYREGTYKGIVTFGGAYSNHIIATACFCAENGIPCIGILRGEEPERANYILMLAELWGMQLKFVSRTQYRGKDELTEKYLKEGYYVIPEGGENKFGIKGCAEIIGELKNEYDHIFCASGTGCTISGILKGVEDRKLDVKCHGIAVLKQGDFLKEVPLRYGIPDDGLTIHTNFHEGGYAKTSKDLTMFIQRFTQKTGILLDPVYTGKLFNAIFKLVEDNYFESGERILAIHSGGLTGWLSEEMYNSYRKAGL